MDQTIWCASYYCDSIIYMHPLLYNHDGSGRNHPNDIDDARILGVQAAHFRGRLTTSGSIQLSRIFSTSSSPNTFQEHALPCFSALYGTFLSLGAGISSCFSRASQNHQTAFSVSRGASSFGLASFADRFLAVDREVASALATSPSRAPLAADARPPSRRLIMPSRGLRF